MSASQVEEATALFLNVSATCADGEPCALYLKAWVHGEIVLWELRRVLISMGVSLSKGVCKIVRRERPMWEADLELLGFANIQDHFVDSRRMAEHHQRSLHQLVHDEMSTSTIGLLVMFCRFAESRRRLADRSKARILLAACIASMIGAKCAELATLVPPPGCVGACAIGARRQEPGDDTAACVHARSLGQRMGAHCVAQTPPHTFLAELLVASFGEASDCLCLRRWCAYLMEEVQRIVSTTGLLEHWSNDALKYGVLPGGQKRRRVDEDLRKQVSVDVVRAKRVASGASWCKATGFLSEQLGNTFDNRSCREYLAAGRACMPTAKIFSIAFDASRIGQPAVDANMFLLWSSDVGQSMWLPPQALCVAGPISSRGGGRSRAGAQLSHSPRLARAISGSGLRWRESGGGNCSSWAPGRGGEGAGRSELRARIVWRSPENTFSLRMSIDNGLLLGRYGTHRLALEPRVRSRPLGYVLRRSGTFYRWYPSVFGLGKNPVPMTFLYACPLTMAGVLCARVRSTAPRRSCRPAGGQSRKRGLRRGSVAAVCPPPPARPRGDPRLQKGRAR